MDVPGAVKGTIDKWYISESQVIKSYYKWYKIFVMEINVDVWGHQDGQDQSMDS